MNHRKKTEARSVYVFGPLEFTVVGLGIFTGHDNLRKLIAALSLEDLKQVNRDAWRQRNVAVRAANRRRNVSVYGWDDARDQHIEVAAAVCLETWKRMAALGGFPASR
jgi:hypothetical protein